MRDLADDFIKNPGQKYPNGLLVNAKVLTVTEESGEGLGGGGDHKRY